MGLILHATGSTRGTWEAIRDTIDLGIVATNLMGAAPGRRGERGRKLWWRCPLGAHADANPSFAVDAARRRWHCYGCGASGDAAALVMRLNACRFPEAIAYLSGGPMPTPSRRKSDWPAPPPRPRHEAKPSGLPAEAAAALVVEAEERLWTPEGAEAVAYLGGPGRCLTVETIRAARLGWSPLAEGVPWSPPGIVIPWLAAGRLALVKLRPPDAWRARYPKGRRPPKYLEAFRDRPTLYPGPEAVAPGRPLVVAEGEFDALLLTQEVGDLAAVVTLGSASGCPDPDILAPLLPASPWFIATDADDAGDKSAERWPASARRVRPPGQFNDWTEAKARGVNLRRWWGDILAGDPSPPLFTWAELSSWTRSYYNSV